MKIDPRIEALEARIPDMSARDTKFARSLIDQYRRSVAMAIAAGPHHTRPKGKSLSEKQWYWVEQLGKPKPAPESVNVGDMAALHALFDKAAEHLKYPKIRLETQPDRVDCLCPKCFCRLPDIKPGPGETIQSVAERVRKIPCPTGCGSKMTAVPVGLPIVIKRAGPRSQWEGDLIITDGEAFGENKWYGRVDKSGQWFKPNKHFPELDQVISLLKAFAADPEGVAGEHGHLFGNCCFCGSELTDERSTAVGYGPTCAKHYGLTWGKEQAA